MPAQSHLHLRAAGLAVLAIAVLLACGVAYALRLERRYIHGLAPEMFGLKNQGIALQKTAFAQGDLLPLYGSSELMKAIPDKASLFFRRYPSDFSVFPIGKAGTTPLIILEKLAALGPAVRDKKVAISISPTWFFIEQINPRYYDGNFSVLQANQLVFSHSLSADLKRDVACRMLSYPHSLAHHSMLDFGLHRLVGGAWRDSIAIDFIRPLAALEQAVARAQDHFESAIYILHHHMRANPPRRPGELDWERLITKMTALASPYRGADASEPVPDEIEQFGGGDREFMTTMSRAHEWENLELLLRGMRELHMRPLLLTMPLNGVHFDRLRISAASRASFYDRMRALADKYETPLVDFREHEHDPKFLVDAHDHMSVEGWIYFNEALDDFSHDRGKIASLPHPARR